MDKIKQRIIPFPWWVRELVTYLMVGYVVLVGVWVYSLHSFAQLQIISNQNRVAEEMLVLAVSDAESGQRGYIFTGNEKCLQQYMNASRNIRTSTRVLREYLKNSPRQYATFLALSRTVDEKINELDATIKAYQSGGPAAARAIFDNGAGMMLRSKISDQIDSLRAQERDEIRRKVANFF